MKKKIKNEEQLLLFEDHPSHVKAEQPTMMEFIKARVDYGPEMTQEEYKRWIKILIHHSLKSMK